ncbi:MAG: T9SS type A sorting domain-containing protein [Bacteroidota bacterium]
MKKNLRFAVLLLCLLANVHQSWAKDFTISGKVSLIQEVVPLPFYDVHIADGEGKYVKTVKTNWNGLYSHTFDIPESEENVAFEVAVIDRCTGESLIEAFVKDGDKATANFLVCGEAIDLGDNEEAEEETTEAETEEGEDGKSGGLTDFLDCEALGVNIPVCFVTETGEVISFVDACEAIDSGLKISQLTFCSEAPDLDIDSLLNGGLGSGLTCEALGITDLELNVCVTETNGDVAKIPVCEALSAGYPLSQIEFCEGGLDSLGGFDLDLDLEDLGIDELTDLLNLDSFDCDLLPVDLPVCVVDADGNSTNFESPCAAFDAGFALIDLSLCDGFIADSLGSILNNFDCEALGINVNIPLCFVNDEGESEEVMLCDLISTGITPEGFELCEGTFDNLDCDQLGIDLPVCTVDESGNELTFDSPCDALDAGIAINELTFCSGIVDSLIDNLSCEAIGLQLDIPVCVTNDTGDSEEVLLCDALSQGVALETIEICPNTLQNLTAENCDFLGIDIPVCFTDDEGNTQEFESLCEAIEEGVNLSDLDLCQGMLQQAMAAFNLTDTEEILASTEMVNIFPNPASQTLFIELNTDQNSTFEARILSMNGNAIYRQKYEVFNGENVVRMDVSSLSVGVYVLQIATANGLMSRKVVISD